MATVMPGMPMPGQGAAQDLFVCDFLAAVPKHDLASMEHPLFSLSTRPDRRVVHYAHNDATLTVTPSVRGRATIFDADILIFCISQLMAGLNGGREISRRLTLRAHDLLVATNRETSGDSYQRLRDALERLAGTRITTNITVGGHEITSGFGLIESWEIVRRSRVGRMVAVTITLSEWLFQAVLARSVLTLSRDYFQLRKPLERRVYELARKHCGRQPEWLVSVPVLAKKSGSASPVRVFRAMLREMIRENRLPDYLLSEEPGDILRITPRAAVFDPADGPHLRPETLAEARALRPGADVYALEAEWRAWWTSTGRPRLRSPDAAFLGWVRTRSG
ncbi:replication initiator protein A [Paracoccus sp. MC1854]|uniref:replication initiator protein A n=1 Tax=Paracoccus sp. MC1854 TaxID=2760306 RepID=UPI0016008BE8|nr:replication initiator protein A [Paracoccus sp. MC1854]MBB1492626.1 replication initiator protein A [Paracoccus sp. MC1854]